MNKAMQAIILAAGQSSRFTPFNTAHKACVSVLGKPILAHTIESVKRAGITEIILVVSPNSHVRQLIGDGRDFGVHVSYVEQVAPTGAGEAILAARSLLQGDFFVLNANRIEFDLLAPQMLLLKKDEHSSVLLAKESKELGSFGALVLEGDRVVDIVEKPEKGKEPSSLKVVGAYLFSKSFLNILASIPLEHYSLEKAIALAGRETGNVFAVKSSLETISLKYAWDLLAIKNYLLENLSRAVSEEADVAETAVIEGNVVIEKGAKIMAGAVITGPCYVGKNAYIGTNAILRNGACVEEDVVIGAMMEVKNSLIGRHTTTHAGFIGDSIIGEQCRIASGFCSANVRLDRETVKVDFQDKKVDSGLKSLGVIVGDSVKIGVRVSTMPGVVIGASTIVGPATMVGKSIAADSLYYTKLEQIVEKKNEKKKIVLFDIDYTLFDVNYFDQHFYRKTAEVLEMDEGIVKKVAQEIITEHMHTKSYLDIETFVDELGEKLEKPNEKDKIETLIFHSGFFKDGFYAEVGKTLKELSLIARIGIFSQGHERFQWAKIDQSGFGHFFEKNLTYIIKPKKIAFLPELKRLHDGDEVFLIDDKPEVIYHAAGQVPSVFTIWLKRGKFVHEADNFDNFHPDAIISNLSEAVDLIKEA